MLADAFGVDHMPGEGKSVWFKVGAADAGGSKWTPKVAHPTDLSEITLNNFPVLLYQVLQEQTEALVREYVLELVSGSSSCHMTVDQIITAERARGKLVDAFQRAIRTIDVGQSAAHVDVSFVVTSRDKADFQLLWNVLEDAERLAHLALLLTRPTLPELRELRRWWITEVCSQAGGNSPTQWRYVDMVQERHPATHEIDLSWVLTTDEAVLVGDESNHIIGVSESAATALGWKVDDLVGQRLMAVIPPSLRESHVAGFTRHLVTGRAHIMRKEVPISALHKDGRELAVLLHLDRHAQGKTTYFVATVTFS